MSPVIVYLDAPHTDGGTHPDQVRASEDLATLDRTEVVDLHFDRSSLAGSAVVAQKGDSDRRVRKCRRDAAVQHAHGVAEFLAQGALEGHAVAVQPRHPEAQVSVERHALDQGAGFGERKRARQTNIIVRGGLISAGLTGASRLAWARTLPACHTSRLPAARWKPDSRMAKDVIPAADLGGAPLTPDELAAIPDFAGIRKVQLVRMKAEDFAQLLDQFPEVENPITEPARARRPLERSFAPPPDAAAWLNLAVTQSESFLFERKCRYCHEYEPAAGAFPVVRKVSQIPGRYALEKAGGETWLPRAEFSHRAHRAAECSSCHTLARGSKETSDVLLPRLQDCLPCHGPTGTPQDRCAKCHLYHDKSQELDRDRRPLEQLLGRPGS
jgi:hypothetical protein